MRYTFLQLSRCPDRGLAGIKPDADETDLEDKIRAEVVSKISAGLMELAGGKAGNFMLPTADTATTAPAETSDDFMAPWLDTPDCTSCDECININPKIFEYNADGKAIIVNPNGGPYQDIVKAAEKCTASVIHPGLPADHSAKDMPKWIKRGEKFN